MSAAETGEAAIGLLRELVACPSVTPKSEGSMEIVERLLVDAGFHIEKMDANGVCNLWATHGSGSPRFAFIGHLDVVPPGDLQAWGSDPFEPTEREGRLYGRGTTDMKGGVAALVACAVRHATQVPRHEGTLAIALTTDEEGPATHGIRHVVAKLAQRGERCDWALVCEPSSDKVFGDTLRVGRRGSLTGVITARGVQGHVAYPDRNVNPIPALADICTRIAKFGFAAGEGLVERTSVEVVNFNADAGAVNVVPGVATATVNFRYNPNDDPAELRARVEGLLSHDGVNMTCSWSDSSKPYYTDPDCELARTMTEACEGVIGVAPSPSVGGGTSDGRFFADICNEVVEFGTTGTTMHMVDEHVELAEIKSLVEIYSRVLTRLLPSS